MTAKRMVNIVDDDAGMRDSLAFLLESAGYDTRVYDSAEDVLARPIGSLEGCIITDVRMPFRSGLDLIRELKRLDCSLPVIVITGHGDIPLAVEAMKEGVVDFLEKPFDDEALLKAVERAYAHMESANGGQAETVAFKAVLERLSAREKEVLAGVIAGKLNKTIAFELGISPRTVEIYRANVMTKTGSAHLSDLIRIALVAGFR